MTRRMLRNILFASLLFAGAAHAQTPLDGYLDQLKTLRAEFEQTVTDGKGEPVQNARGTLVIVRPGRAVRVAALPAKARAIKPNASGRYRRRLRVLSPHTCFAPSILTL